MRKAIPFFTLALLLCLISTSTAQTSSGPTDDTQFWSDVQFALPLVKDQKDKELITLVLAGTLRVGRNITHLVDERAAVTVDFNFRKVLKDFNFKFTPGYLYQAAQPFEGRKTYEHRVTFSVTPEYTLGNFKLKDRNLFERRLRTSQSDLTRYRNRFEIEYAINPNNLKVFAADEIFYDWSVNDWVRNRFTVGARKEFGKEKPFTAELYYLRQNDGRSRPGDLHVIGTLFKITLR